MRVRFKKLMKERFLNRIGVNKYTDMKLISFRGENIRGYQNHCINFHDGVTFLIGINGSGKTTVLNLIQGLLTPSLKILATIEYSYIEIELVVNQDMKKNCSIKF